MITSKFIDEINIRISFENKKKMKMGRSKILIIINYY